MLYESTKSLLESILRSLETGDETRWDDQTESGNACLYEMHQMCGPLYRAYRSDRLNANSIAQTGFPEKLNRAIPHVRLMVIAIRHKDRSGALGSGKAALAEMNGVTPSMPTPCCPELTTTSSPLSNMLRQKGNYTIARRRVMVEGRKTSKRNGINR